MRELGAAPGPEITALYERLLFGERVGPTLAPAGSARPEAFVPASTVGGAIAPLLVGRDAELDRLNGWMRIALQGNGRVALITGEAGIGKTALLDGFARQAMLDHEGLLVAMGGCSAHSGAGDAYQPFREIMHMLTGDPESVLGPEHARRLRQALPTTCEALVEHGPDLVQLLARDPDLVARGRACASQGARWPRRLERLATQVTEPGAGSPQQRALCDQLARVLRAVAGHQPLLLGVDDLQWADAPTYDMLFHLARHLAGSRILLVATFRPEGLEPRSTGVPLP
jgi:predicted ATPase